MWSSSLFGYPISIAELDFDTLLSSLRKKSEAFQAFKDYQKEVENLHNFKIKAFQTDRAGEFCGFDFEDYLKSEGIVHRKTVANFALQNGIAERMNLT